MHCEALLAAVKAGFAGACGVLPSKPLLEGARCRFLREDCATAAWESSKKIRKAMRVCKTGARFDGRVWHARNP
jgi:hypothetical protein